MCGTAGRGEVTRWGGVCLAMAVAVLLLGACAQRPAPVPVGLADDDALLEEIQKRCLRFLWEQADPDTGLVADRARGDGRNHPKMASIASTGFALTAVCIADERGWLEHDAAYGRVLTTLRHLWEKQPHRHGWFYHFVNMRTGKRAWKSEVSSIDTALLMCGVLTARQAYPGTEVQELATKIYERIDFEWMTNGSETLSMGWKPELVKKNGTGFLPQHWNNYAEHMALDLMALGSPTHPRPASSWHAWRRRAVYDYQGKTFFGSPVLFTHQYSHAFVNFAGLRDDYADYALNSRIATLAQRRMCADQLSAFFPHYGENVWGISSSEFVDGYTGWGGPPATTNIDGTVVPYAVTGSLVFTPNESMDAIRHLSTVYAQQYWTHYGPSAAFNPATGWKARDVLGIDQGITFVMIENHRTGRVWELFMANPEIAEAMRVADFRPLTEEEAAPGRTTSLFRLDGSQPIPADALTAARFGPHDAQVYPLDTGWDAADWKALRPDNALEWGQPTDRHGLSGRFAFLWDAEALHLRVRVADADVSNDAKPAKLFKQDSVEVFLDPDHDGMVWKDRDDFRIGLSPMGQRWEWFGQRDGYGSQIVRTDDGYEVRATFPWRWLKARAKAGQTLGATVAIKSVDQDDGLIRLNWCFRGKRPPILLGDLHLR